MASYYLFAKSDGVIATSPNPREVEGDEVMVRVHNGRVTYSHEGTEYTFPAPEGNSHDVFAAVEVHRARLPPAAEVIEDISETVVAAEPPILTSDVDVVEVAPLVLPAAYNNELDQLRREFTGWRQEMAQAARAAQDAQRGKDDDGVGLRTSIAQIESLVESQAKMEEALRTLQLSHSLFSDRLDKTKEVVNMILAALGAPVGQ